MATGGHYITMLSADWSISTSHDPLPSSCHSKKMLWNPSIACIGATTPCIHTYKHSSHTHTHTPNTHTHMHTPHTLRHHTHTTHTHIHLTHSHTHHTHPTPSHTHLHFVLALLTRHIQLEVLRLLHCKPLLVHVLLQPSTHVHKIAALCGMCEWVCSVTCVVCGVCKCICVYYVCVCVCVYGMCGRKNCTQSLEWNADIVRQDWNGKWTELGDYQDVTGSGMEHEYHWSRRRAHLGGALTAGPPACSSATAPNYDDCSRIACQPYPLISPQLSNVLHVYETPANTLCVLMIYAMWLL